MSSEDMRLLLTHSLDSEDQVKAGREEDCRPFREALHEVENPYHLLEKTRSLSSF